MTNRYQILIKGHIDKSWAEWFDGFTLIHQDDGTTLMTGPVIDQADLHGRLERINSLGLTLIFIKQEESESSSKE